MSLQALLKVKLATCSRRAFHGNQWCETHFALPIHSYPFVPLGRQKKYNLTTADAWLLGLQIWSGFRVEIASSWGLLFPPGFAKDDVDSSRFSVKENPAKECILFCIIHHYSIFCHLFLSLCSAMSKLNLAPRLTGLRSSVTFVSLISCDGLECCELHIGRRFDMTCWDHLGFHDAGASGTSALMNPHDLLGLLTVVPSMRWDRAATLPVTQETSATYSRNPATLQID